MISNPLIKKIFSPLIVLISLTQILSCKQGAVKSKFSNSDLYNLSTPFVMELPIDLDEISGVAYYPIDTSVFAIIDEDGLMFKIHLNRPYEVKQWKFDKARDFEDIVLIDSIFYVLISNGDVRKVEFSHDSIITEKLNFSDVKKSVNEYESMFIGDSGKVVMMCKDCEEDKKAKISSFSFNNMDSMKVLNPFLTIDMVSIAEKTGLGKTKLKPSAAAFNPVNGDLYIISAINKILIITDHEGNFKEYYKLNPELYKQPEGITFTPAGDLIISNEFAQVGKPTLLILKNKKKGK